MLGIHLMCFKLTEMYAHVLMFPIIVQDKLSWSINNHHNALLACYESNCSEIKWKPTFIAGGANINSFQMQDHHKTDKQTNVTFFIQLFGPDLNSTYIKPKRCFYESKTDTKNNYVSNKLVELQIQVDQLKQNQDNFQNDIRKQHMEYFNKLTDALKEI